MRFITLIFIFLFCFSAVSAQNIDLDRKFYESPQNTFSIEQKTSVLPPLAIQKSPGHYTKQQWRALIDSFWGPGLPTADKLKMFDDFWDLVDQKWGGFPNLVVNWDSLKNVYRPEVAAGVSRGRFSAILSRLTRALSDGHVYIVDTGIDNTMGYNAFSTSERYNYPSFRYQAHVPLINIEATFFRTIFGAGLTPLPDSSALVYSVIPNHPLGLQPGDIILGYDGVSWMRSFNELLGVELPIMESGAMLSATKAAALHVAISSTGMNWGLFDTIDVKKYGTNQVIHFPTSLLDSIKPPYLIATEQIPVRGVAFPDLENLKMVSWGVITDTKIGYIYVWDWASITTRSLFTKAVDELMHKYSVEGIILDFRKNAGGTPNYANGGFNHLFNVDPLSHYSIAKRDIGLDHLSFTNFPYNTSLLGPLVLTSEVYDHPIAVLTGPRCASAGDYNAHRMRFHPMSRFFGLPTTGAYTAYETSADYDAGIWNSDYRFRVDHCSVYSDYKNEGFLIHNPFPVDEQVWLSRDGAAKGEDDVVKKAMEWINTAAYAYSPKTAKSNYGKNDSVVLTVNVKNPQNHLISILGKLMFTNMVGTDSSYFFNDGKHGDGASGDSIWGCYLMTPSVVDSFYYSIRFEDKTAGTAREIFYKNPVTTPVEEVIEQLPVLFALSQNYPNPFNPTTVISYQLPVNSMVSLKIYDLLGREIATLVNEEQSAGWKEVKWNAKDVSSGIYFYKLTAGNFVETKKMMVMK